MTTDRLAALPLDADEEASLRSVAASWPEESMEGSRMTLVYTTIHRLLATLDAERAAAGVTIATPPAEYAEEAVYAALLYIHQRTPRPRAAVAFMEALKQDGYEVRPIAQPAPDLRAEPDPNAAYASGKTHGWHRDDGANHDECREYVVGKCVLRSQPAPDLRAAAQAVVEHRAGSHGITEYRCGASFDAHIDALRAALAQP